MQKPSIRYLHLAPESGLPPLDGLQHFKAVLVIEAEVADLVLWETSRLLVEYGCKYALAWGRGCESWHDAIEDAYLEATNYEDVPEAQRVMATWHEDEELDEVFWFASHRAVHPAHELRDILILHIADAPRREELEAQFREQL
jgi:hypothetical protein